MQVKLGQQ